MIHVTPTSRGTASRFLVSVSCICFLFFDELKAAEAADSLALAVDQAFDIYPRLTGEGRLKPVDVRSFLEHLRRQEQGSRKGTFPSTSYAEEQHVNTMFHALMDHVYSRRDISREEFQVAMAKVSDKAEEHLLYKEPTGQAACEGLPEAILRRKGSCELKRLRHKLESTRTTTPLFDTARWVGNFERGLQMMWEIYAAGLKPMHTFVTNSGESTPPSHYDHWYDTKKGTKKGKSKAKLKADEL
mmetsp:Transcript_37163/g.80906  ORF Transcript_37163/g.80906 Transcript_37163/m.80906 type:complete len:243 (-) Transcript_37163:96-824(-)|eukprot:CAMPEP_0118921824 /NCGR_PEP_ID=MMETSP1169-20130426/980_1 /TAXON_ID=36882 /ORGANISM="Pyramimonas obovata, Strain CCMP722" /LENGTH=242 /DNA_ID=CAMNT_0006862615 /DNA_START=195 /DNA_END=923 /DNA_ORIENTATION=-